MQSPLLSVEEKPLFSEVTRNKNEYFWRENQSLNVCCTVIQVGKYEKEDQPLCWRFLLCTSDAFFDRCFEKRVFSLPLQTGSLEFLETAHSIAMQAMSLIEQNKTKDRAIEGTKEYIVTTRVAAYAQELVREISHKKKRIEEESIGENVAEIIKKTLAEVKKDWINSIKEIDYKSAHLQDRLAAFADRFITIAAQAIFSDPKTSYLEIKEALQENCYRVLRVDLFGGGQALEIVIRKAFKIYKKGENIPISFQPEIQHPTRSLGALPTDHTMRIEARYSAKLLLEKNPIISDVNILFCDKPAVSSTAEPVVWSVI